MNFCSRLAGFLVLPFFLAAAAWSSPLELYVSPVGHDDHPGTREQPIATLQKARSLIREARSRTDGPITVYLLPGTFYLRESFILGPEDSGTPDAPITWQAVEEGSTTVSGGARLECHWEADKDGIAVCDLPAAKGRGFTFTELYVNGRRQVRARFPNGDPRIPQPAGYILTKGATPSWQNPPHQPHTELLYDPATFTQKVWAHPEDAVVSCFQRINFDGVPFWNGQWRVRGLDPARNAILLGEGGHQQLLWHYMQAYRPGIYPDMPFYVENVLEELDSPGEWFLDTRRGKLYYKPGSDLDLQTAIFECSGVQSVIQFLGTKAKPVRFITLRGLKVAHACSTFFEPYTSAGMGDYTIHRGGAILLQGAEDIRVDRCSLEGNNGNGFFVNGYARRIQLTNSRVVDVGESGICFVGKDNYRTDKRYRCPTCGFDHWWGWDPLSEDDLPSDCSAVNNVVHDVGVYAKQCGGVFIANALRIRIAGNHIYNCPRAGINVNSGLYGGHVFERNDLHDTVRETSDHGPFNSYGRDAYWCQHVNHPGCLPEGQPPHKAPANHDFGSPECIARSARETTVVRSNRFDGARLGGRLGPGLQHPIDLDDGSSNYEVYSNFGIRMSIKTFCSSDCKFYGNIFFEARPLDLLQPFNGRLEIRDNHFVENLALAEAEAKFFPGVRFGVNADFPAWLCDPDVVSILPRGGQLCQGDAVTLETVFDGPMPEIHFTRDGSSPDAQSPIYREPFRLMKPETVRAQAFRDGLPAGPIAVATFGPVIPIPDVFLDELPLAIMKSGNENPVKRTQIRKNCVAKPLRLAGVTYQRGIGDHAGNGFDAELAYALKPEFRRFIAIVGVDDQGGKRGSLEVRIFADDQLLIQTPILRGGESPYHVDIALPPGARLLRFIISDAGDGYFYDDANFANAGFVLESSANLQK